MMKIWMLAAKGPRENAKNDLLITSGLNSSKLSIQS